MVGWVSVGIGGTVVLVRGVVTRGGARLGVGGEEGRTVAKATKDFAQEGDYNTEGDSDD